MYAMMFKKFHTSSLMFNYENAHIRDNTEYATTFLRTQTSGFHITHIYVDYFTMHLISGFYLNY